jgi:hypothetical protein
MFTPYFFTESSEVRLVVKRWWGRGQPRPYFFAVPGIMKGGATKQKNQGRSETAPSFKLMAESCELTAT